MNLYYIYIIIILASYPVKWSFLIVLIFSLGFFLILSDAFASQDYIYVMNRKSSFVNDESTLSNNSTNTTTTTTLPPITSIIHGPPVFDIAQMDSGPRLIVLARVYHKQFSYIPQFLSCFINENIPIRIFFIVTDTKSDPNQLQSLLDWYQNSLNIDMASILPITSQDAFDIYNPSPPNPNDYGYSYTDAAIEYLIDQEIAGPNDYILFTNADNIYSTGMFTNYILHYMELEYQMIAFDMISHHQRGDVFQNDKESSTGTQFHLSVSFQVAFIDLGALVFRFSLFRDKANSNHLQFVPTEIRVASHTPGQSVSWNSFVADGDLIVKAASMCNKTMIIRQTLFLHQVSHIESFL